MEWFDADDLAAVEVVFLSPPWGGVDYAQAPSTATFTTNTNDNDNHNHETTIASTSAPSTYSLTSVLPIDGTTLFSRVHTAFSTSNIAYYLPRNTDLTQLSHLPTLLTSSSEATPAAAKVKSNTNTSTTDPNSPSHRLLRSTCHRMG